MKTAKASQQNLRPLKIPSLPAVVMKLNELIRDPDVGVLEIAEELSKDPDLSTRVLRIANGASYGLKTPVLDPRHAASILGLERLAPIILQAGTKRLFAKGEKRTEDDMKRHWKHSILVAQISKSLGERCKNPDLMEPEALYTCGLLHDMGKAVFWDNKPNKYKRCVEIAQQEKRDLLEVETEIMGVNHAQVGAKIVVSWGLPRNLAQTIVFHHDAWKVAKVIPTAVLIALADRLAHAVELNELAGMPAIATQRDFTFLGLDLGGFLTVATGALASWNEIEV